MTAARLASLLAVLAAVLLAVVGVLSLRDGYATTRHQTLSHVGYGAAVAALACLGYSLVSTAPLWLRLISSAGMALLVAAVWEAVEEWLRNTVDSAAGHAVAATHLSAAALLLIASVVTWRRTPRAVERPADPARGHRH